MEAPGGAVPVALRVARLIHPLSGPGRGRRLGLWVNGCTLGCAGCLAPTLWPAEGGALVDVQALAEAIADTVGLDGLNISGGEPFQQYGPLMALCSYLKALRPIEILSFSGYTLAELEANHPDRTFTRCLDLLVDGRYEAKQAEGGWRGSANQRLYRFVDGEAREEHGLPEGGLSAAVPDGDSFFLVGIPKPGELTRLQRLLRESGFPLRHG